MADPVTPEVDPAAVPVTDTSESLTAKYKAGQLGLPSQKRIPVRLGDGQIGTVLGKDAGSVIDAGGSLLDDETYRAHQLEKKHGGLTGALAAGAEGLARGVTVGGSDIAAIEAARAVGGERAAEATRQHLEGGREANPILSGGTELAGAALPLVLSEGATAPEQAGVLGARLGLEGAAAAGTIGEGTAAARALAESASVAKSAVTAADAATSAKALAAAAKAAEAARAAEQTASAVDAASSAVAGVAGNVRTAVRGAGIANRGIASAGEQAANLTKALVGEGTGTGIGAFGQRLAAKASQGIVEGGLYGVASEVDESVLGDHDLNAEKLLAAAGHGALLGGAFTGSLETMGSLSRNVLGRVAPHLQAQAENQAWKSLSPLKKFTEEAEARMPGGSRAVGRVLLEEGVIPESLAGATPEMLAPRIEAAQQRVATELGQVMDQTGAKVKVNDVLGAVDEIVNPLRKKAGFEPIVKALDEYKASLVDKLAPMVEHEGELETKLVKRQILPEELISDWIPKAESGGEFRPGWTPGAKLEPRGGEFIKSEIKTVNRRVSPAELEKKWVPMAGGPTGFTPEFMTQNGLRIENGAVFQTEQKIAQQAVNPMRGFTPEFMAKHGLTSSGNKLYVTEQQLTGAAKKILTRPTEVSVQALFEQRRALDDLVYKEVKSLDPKMRVEFMREIRGKLANMEVEAIDTASKAAGSGPSGAELKDLRRRYQALRIAGDAAETSTSRMATNRNFSMSDNLHFVAAAASGHLGFAPVAAIGHKLIRERGNAVAAYTLNKLAAFSAVERAAASIDRQVDRGVAGFLKAGSKAEVTRRPSGFKTTQARIEAVAKAVADTDGHAATIERAVAEIAPHAPNTARAFQRGALTATSYLASQIPASAQQFHSPTPHVEQPRLSDAESAKFNRVFEAVNDPTSVLHDMAKGTAMPDQIEALKKTSPLIYKQIVTQVQAKLADRKKPLPYEKRKQLSLLMGIPLDPTLAQPFVKRMQANFGPKGGGQGGQGSAPASAAVGMPSGAPKRKLSDDIVTSHRLSGL